MYSTITTEQTLKISLLDITRKKNQSVFFNCHRIVTKNWDLTE